MSLGTGRHARVRCAIYTRKSSEEGLDQEFNSLQAQREACEAFITSQRHEGWVCLRTGYDDGGFSGATMATTSFTAPAYGKFESSPLQQTVRLSRDFSLRYRKAGSCRGVRGPG